MLARNTILQSRYRIVRPLGKGGMGQVYEAIDDTVDSIVAIKETFANTDKLRNAFEREAKLLASLRHPVLPRVMHHFLQGDRQFLVMDFVEGLNLAQLLDLRGIPFRYEAVLPWTDKLLDALAYLHGQREPIIHRDIKPANIKVTNEGEIYLLDFGLAKGAPGQETSSVHGYTAAYAPLEQLNNSGTNAQSDLYSLGATLYHLLTGDLPVSASKRDEIIEEGNRDPLIPMHQSNPNVPEPLSVIIAQAMAMKRRDRFVSATGMSVVLREAALMIEREREQKILETPTRLTDEAARSREHKLVLRETEAAADLGDQRMVNPVGPWKDLGREDVYQKTMSQVTPPVVPPAPPSDPAQRSWPSHIDSEPSPAIIPDVKKELAEEEERLLKEAEARRMAEEEERKRADQEAARQAEEAKKRAEGQRLREEAERERVAAEEQRLQEEERKRWEAAERRSEEEKRQAEDRRKQAEEHAHCEALGTIPGPFITQPLPSKAETSEATPLLVSSRVFWDKKRIAFAVTAPLILIGIVIVSVWSWPGGNKVSSLVNKQLDNQPTKPTSTQPINAPTHKLTKRERAQVNEAIDTGNKARDKAASVLNDKKMNPNERDAEMKKQYAEAESQYQHALLIDPSEARSHNGLANLYYDQARYSDAIEEFKKAIEIDPTSAGSHYGLGLAYLITDNKSDAMEEYDALKSLKSKYADKLLSEINKH